MSAMPHGQRSPTLQRCTEPRAAGYPAEPQDWGAVARPDQVGPDPALVPRPKGWSQANQREG